MAHISWPRGTLAAWEQVTALFGPVCANRAEQPLEGRGEGLRTRVGTGQAVGRWPGTPRTLSCEHPTASIGQRLPGLDAATPDVEPMEKARQE